jgi:uncharacterized protein YjbJ (UPF0337 family)
MPFFEQGRELRGAAFVESLSQFGFGKCKENAMNWDQIEGNWKQFAGKAREKWGKLTDDEMDQVEGKREQLVGKVQERYGLAKEEAEDQVKTWERSL